MNRLVSFQIDGGTYGIDALSVIEILRPQALTPVPRAPASVAGLLNLRGQIIAAISLRERLGLESRPDGMNIIVRTPEGPASLLVDRIGDVLECDPTRWSQPPDTLPGALRGLVVGSYHFPDRLLLVLDADRAAHPEGTGVLS